MPDILMKDCDGLLDSFIVLGILAVHFLFCFLFFFGFVFIWPVLSLVTGVGEDFVDFLHKHLIDIISSTNNKLAITVDILWVME